jgi:NhaA family Na+:H+ antiporter
MLDHFSPSVRRTARFMATHTQPKIDVILQPFMRFARMEAAGGILLLAATAAALVWANSPWAPSYDALWHVSLSFGFGPFLLAQDLHHWINDGLMCIFFFVVGLEIKREVLSGELSSIKRAALPFAAALGGVVIPALIFVAFNHSTEDIHGWAVPMATDIAFALGVLALLGNRVPVALKIFVTALAIVDDIVAVLIIAIFYTEKISLHSLIAGLIGIAISYLANRLGIRKPMVYALIGIFVWLATLKSGVHATIAGILLAFTIPTETFLDVPTFLRRSAPLLEQIKSCALESAELASHDCQGAAHQLEQQSELLQQPLYRIEHLLQPWVTFLIMPLFALANAGVPILGNSAAVLHSPVSLGVALGLLIGKPIGISLFSWIAVKIGLAAKPDDVRWPQLIGASTLCGIGFTMSLFIANLAFGLSPALDLSKIGTLSASLASGILGSIILRRTAPPRASDS